MGSFCSHICNVWKYVISFGGYYKGFLFVVSSCTKNMDLGAYTTRYPMNKYMKICYYRKKVSNYSNSIPLLLSEVQSCPLGYCLFMPLWSAYFLWVMCCLLPVVFAVLLHNALPFVGFGFLDNCIMIVAVSMSASSSGCGGSVGVGSLISTGGTVA